MTYYVSDLLQQAPPGWTIHGAFSHRDRVNLWQALVDAGLPIFTEALEVVVFRSNDPYALGQYDQQAAQMHFKDGKPFAEVAEFLWLKERSSVTVRP